MRLRWLLPSTASVGAFALLFWAATYSAEDRVPPPQLSSEQSVETVQVTEEGSTLNWSFVPFDADALQRIAERPLFSETRRRPETRPIPLQNAVVVVTDPPAEKARPKPKSLPAPKPPKLDYLGFMADENGPKALLRLKETTDEIWFSVGQTVAEWSISEISMEQIRLNRGSHSHFVQKNQ